jgi:hypothetical protein
MSTKRRTKHRKPKAARHRKQESAPAPTSPTRVKINDTQRLAADLMSCRSRLQRKDLLIASLYDEITALRKEVLQAGVNAEARENQITAEKYGLPVVFENLGRDEDGEWYVECAPAQIPSGPPAKVLKLPEPELPDDDESEEEEETEEPEPELSGSEPETVPPGDDPAKGQEAQAALS